MVFKTFSEPVPELKWELLSWILKRTDKPLIPDAKHSGNNFFKIYWYRYLVEAAAV